MYYFLVCAFPYIMAFAEDLLEIRLVANGSLVHAACIPGLKMLCGKRVRTFFCFLNYHFYFGLSLLLFSIDIVYIHYHFLIKTKTSCLPGHLLRGMRPRVRAPEPRNRSQLGTEPAGLRAYSADEQAVQQSQQCG